MLVTEFVLRKALSHIANLGQDLGNLSATANESGIYTLQNKTTNAEDPSTETSTVMRAHNPRHIDSLSDSALQKKFRHWAPDPRVDAIQAILLDGEALSQNYVALGTVKNVLRAGSTQFRSSEDRFVGRLYHNHTQR